MICWIESVGPIVSFAAVFRDVTQRSPERKFLSGERCVTSRKTAAKETIGPTDDLCLTNQIYLFIAGGGGGGQKTPIAPGTFFVSESSNKK